MSIKIVTSLSATKNGHRLDELSVLIDTNTLTVEAATLSWDDLIDYAFDEVDYEYTPDATYQTDLIGYICRDASPDPDDLVLFVDEVLKDGVDDVYDFAGTDLTPIHVLFIASVPATVDLDTVETTVFYLNQD